LGVQICIYFVMRENKCHDSSFFFHLRVGSLRIRFKDIILIIRLMVSVYILCKIPDNIVLLANFRRSICRAWFILSVPGGTTVPVVMR